MADTNGTTTKKRKVEMDVEAGRLTFTEYGLTFHAGEIEGMRQMFGELPGIGRQLLLHGLKQKLSDSTAGMKDATADEKAQVVKNVWEAVQKGEWSVRGEGGGGVQSFKAKAIRQIRSGELTDQQVSMIVVLGILKQSEVDEILEEMA